MSHLLQDLRYGARMLWKNPGFTLVAIFTIALGIGANTAIFSAVNAVLLRPLPYRNADELVMIWDNFLRLEMRRLGVSPPEFIDYKEQNTVFEDVAAFSNLEFNLTGENEPERITGARVTANLFPLLGVAPMKGRNFSAEEDRAGAAAVVVLSHGLWQRRFGSAPDLIGRAIRLNGNS